MSSFHHCVKIINQKAGKVCLGHNFGVFSPWLIVPNAWAYGNRVHRSSGM